MLMSVYSNVLYFHVIVLYKIILLGQLMVIDAGHDITYGSDFSLF